MKSIKTIIIALLLGLAGIVNVSGSALAVKDADCCVAGASCCTGDECCTHKAKW